MEIATRLEAIDKNAEKVETRLQKIKKLADTGDALAKAGKETALMWKDELDAASKYHTVLERISLLQPGSLAANDRFIKSLEVKGQSYTDLASLYGGAQTILQDSTQAQQVTEMLAQMKSGLMAATGSKDGAKFEELVLSALKVAQMRDGVIDPNTGKIDTQKVRETLDAVTNSYLVSNGKVEPKDYQEAVQSGKLSTKFTQTEAAFFGLKQFMQSAGASNTSVAAMTTLQGWTSGKMSPTAVRELERVKLLDHKAVHRDKSGHIVGVDATGMARSQEFAANPFKYVADVIVPALQKQGYTGDRLNTKLEAILGAKDASLANVLLHEQDRAGKYLQNRSQAGGVSQTYEKANEGHDAKLKDYEAKVTNLKITLGENILPLAIAGLEKFSHLIEKITKLAQEHPEVAKGVMLAVTGLTLFKKLLPVLVPPAGGGGSGKGSPCDCLKLGESIARKPLRKLGGALGSRVKRMSKAGMSALRKGAEWGRRLVRNVANRGRSLANGVRSVGRRAGTMAKSLGKSTVSALRTGAGWGRTLVRNMASRGRSLATGVRLVGRNAGTMVKALGATGVSVLRKGAGLGRGLLSTAGALAKSPLKGVLGAVGALVKSPVARTALRFAGPVGLAVNAIDTAWQVGKTAYQVGSWANTNLINPLAERMSGVKGATLGTYLYDLLHPGEGKKLTSPPTTPYSNEGHNRSPVVGSSVKIADQKPVILKGDVTMDGRSVGQVVWKQINGNLARPQTGSSSFNTGMQLMPSGL
ncbi:phage tail tape measure protein [Ralstonia sp. A12]|uniref:phage tail tape measure protein n=1 Tax=Ralstonia sp. A12 TaxID=1217052 RepID=UPI0018DCB497|nr:phage tail tape measure protein [Ralstonia sp. A12]